ncbi:MAG: ATP-binding protein, partial [Terriglobia bacterium]
DVSFLNKLPPTVDPCGENGEFHSFVFDAPMFEKPIDFSVGETVLRDGFVFTDLVVGNGQAD